MVVVVHVVVVDAGAEVPSKQAVVATFVDTAIGQHCDWERTRFVRVGVEERVVVAYGGCAHCAISQSLVGVFFDVVLLHGRRILHCAQQSQFHLVDRLVRELTRNADVGYREVHIVIIQFIEDVEWSIVASVELVRVESTRGVQRIRVRVDVEVTLHFTRNGIDFRAQCTRSSLLTIRSVANHVELQLLRQVVSRVQVGSVTLNLALQCPTRVGHSRD